MTLWSPENHFAMPGKLGMRKTVRWNEETMKLIMSKWQELRDEGWMRISIRKVLYKLLDVPGWTKDHYDTMCVRLGEWRDDGLIEFGLFADSGGADHVPAEPMSPEDVEEAIESLRAYVVPTILAPDGYLHIVLVEHAEDVYDIADMLDGTCVVSSGGQLRREHLHLTFRRIQRLAEKLGAKGIKAITLVDYDKGGEDIYETHRKWLRRIFDLDLVKWGITSVQVRAAGLPPGEDHQLEGWSALYGRDRLERELRSAVGLPPR